MFLHMSSHHRVNCDYKGYYQYVQILPDANVYATYDMIFYLQSLTMSRHKGNLDCLVHSIATAHSPDAFQQDLCGDFSCSVSSLRAFCGQCSIGVHGGGSGVVQRGCAPTPHMPSYYRAQVLCLMRAYLPRSLPFPTRVLFIVQFICAFLFRAQAYRNMDPFSALGLAANLLQFIELGWTLVTNAREIATTGSTKRNERLEETCHNFSVILGNLDSSFEVVDASNQRLSLEESALRALAIRCKDTSTELSAILEKLRVDQQASTHTKNLRKSFRSLWESRKINDLASRLSEYRSELVANLSALTRYSSCHSQLHA